MTRRHRKRRIGKRRRQRGKGNDITNQLVNLAAKNLVDTATVGINSGFKSAQSKIKKLFKGKKKPKKTKSQGAKPHTISATTYRTIGSPTSVLLP